MPVAHVKRDADPEIIPYWWYPGRLGVELAPQDFLDKLVAIHPSLSCTKYPLDGTWMLWSRNPEVTHRFCPGWSLLFLWMDEKQKPLPLDSRVFFNLYRRDPRRYRRCVDYFDQINAELKDAKDRREVAMDNDRNDRVHDFQQYTKIKNIGHGSKSALHHDGTVLPSRGELLWLQQRGNIWGGRRKDAEDMGRKV